MVTVNINPDSREGLPIGTNVKVNNQGTSKFFRITNRDTIFYRDAHASLATGATEAFAEITNLNPPSTQAFAFHDIIIDGNVEVSLKQPAATNRWGTQRSPTGGLLLDKYSVLGGGEPVNIWTMEDFPPNVQLVNNTDVSIVATLWWVGWRYEMDEISGASPPREFVEVAVGPPTR